MNTPHPELEALAELADPAEPTPGADELLAHVEACEQCKADVAALRGVRHSLRSLPPVPMPDDVAARLESAMRAAAEADPEPVGAVSVLPAREQRTAARRERWFPQFSAAAVVAVLVVIALGTGIGVMISQSGGETKGGATSSAAGSESSGPVLITSGADYQQATIRNQIAALVLTRVPQAPQQFKGLHSLADAAAAGSAAAGGSAPAAAPSAAPASAGAGSFGGVATPSRSLAAARTAISGPLADPAALQACILALVQKPETPVLVDYANYQGKPATIIVLADPSTPSTLDVYVEADTADCAKSGDVTFVTFLPAAS
ncbi:MAG TPA: hypothetical protein VN738_04060 [Acidothermaceae bacterium]|nr:hypothetical protein [Acidothermaceae bacterium]